MNDINISLDELKTSFPYDFLKWKTSGDVD
jgi:hypothetical protein